MFPVNMAEIHLELGNTEESCMTLGLTKTGTLQ